MTKKEIINLKASVRQKLLNISKTDNKQFIEILQYYAMERFLFRLSKSKYKKIFILKGGLMLRVWGGPSVRPTMDIDMLGQIKNDLNSIVLIVKEVCESSIIDDGLEFDTSKTKGTLITKDGDYKGVRTVVPCYLGSARMIVQIDFGFGDIIYPKAVPEVIPGLLDQPKTVLDCYPRETLIAEKFQAMIHLGERNTRMKDFFDIWFLSKYTDFNSHELIESVKLTFKKRDTVISNSLLTLTLSVHLIPELFVH